MIVTLITAITTDLISAYIVESGNSIIKRIKSWFFMRKLNRWVCDFIIANEGSVLESSSFKTFIEKNGPLQAEILGKLFQAYVCRKIDWEEFCDFSDALDRLFISDIPLLINVLHEDIVNPEGKEAYKGDRLSAMGLVDTKTNFAETTVDVINIDRIIRITEFGRRFVQYGLSQ